MQTAPPDPFGLSSDPHTYVARAATEAALDRLEEAILAGSPVVHLHGPPGIGKTLLLHVLRQRLEGRFQFVYLPYPRMEPGGLWLWVGSALGIAASLDARRGMRRLAAQAHAAGGALVLTVDEAGMLPGASLRDLVATAGSEPGLQVVLASLEADDLAPVLEPGTPEVPLTQPMSLEETRRYVSARLVRRDVPEALLARFDDRVVAWLQRESGGIPLLVHALADAVARGGDVTSMEGPVPAPAEMELRDEPEEELPPPPTRLGARRGRPRRRPRAPSRPGLAVALAALIGLALGLLAEPFTGLGQQLVALLPTMGPRTLAYAAPEAAAPATLPAVGTPPPPEPAPAPADELALPSVDAGPPDLPEAQAPVPAVTPPRDRAAGGTASIDAPAEPTPAAAGATRALAQGVVPQEQAEPVPPAGGVTGGEAQAEVEPPAPVVPAPSSPALPEEASPLAEASPGLSAPRDEPAERAAALPPVSAAPPTPGPPAAAPPEPAPTPARTARRQPRPTGLLRVRAPAGTIVSVDGDTAGPAPIAPIALPQGTHRVRVRHADGVVAQRTIELGDGATVVFYPPEEDVVADSAARAPRP